MGLRESLAARVRRTAVIRLGMAGAAEAVEMVAAQRVMLAHAQQYAAENGEQPVEDARDRLAVLLAASEDAHAVLHLQALPASDWEAALATYPPAEGSEDLCNWSSALPSLLAASCTDEGGDDAGWWAAELGEDRWSAGQLDTLRSVLMDLNLRPAQVALDPKG